MTAGPVFKPIARKAEGGRIDVYISASYQRLPREAALSLFQQLAVALDMPYSEGVALFAAKVLHAHRGDSPDEVSDVDGGDVQEFALESELLETFECPSGGCSSGCLCDEGDRCLRGTPLGLALIKLLDAEPTTREVRL